MEVEREKKKSGNERKRMTERERNDWWKWSEINQDDYCESNAKRDWYCEPFVKAIINFFLKKQTLLNSSGNMRLFYLNDLFKL